MLTGREKTCEQVSKKSYGPNVKIAPYHGSKNSTLRKGFPKDVKRVIAVHSGKGGVGKTFVAVNLAVYLASKGLRVGLLDADVDCPNVMRVMGLEGKLVANARKKIVPLEKFGVKVVSLAPMQKSQDQAIMWRGPVISKAIEQFVHDTDWVGENVAAKAEGGSRRAGAGGAAEARDGGVGARDAGALDFLIVDLPPGTSDAPISVLNILKGAEVLVVTTPQKLAVIDAAKSVNMARELGAKVIGLIENMSGEIFGGGRTGTGTGTGRGGAKEAGTGARSSAGTEAVAATLTESQKMAIRLKIPFLGSIELSGSYLRDLENGEIPALNDQNIQGIFSLLTKTLVE